ncbi:hypothetical protein [Selenomonas montiformis]|nr:hypothetical protein [Selenomonas montiformis]
MDRRGDAHGILGLYGSEKRVTGRSRKKFVRLADGMSFSLS